MREREPGGQISPALRFEVFKRDGFKCHYCGLPAPDAVLEVDHVVPLAEGGGNEMGNLISACYDCNRGKRGRPLTTNTLTSAELEERYRPKSQERAPNAGRGGARAKAGRPKKAPDEKAKMLALKLPPALIAEIDKAAAIEGVNRTQWLVRAAEERLKRHRQGP